MPRAGQVVLVLVLVAGTVVGGVGTVLATHGPDPGPSAPFAPGQPASLPAPGPHEAALANGTAIESPSLVDAFDPITPAIEFTESRTDRGGESPSTTASQATVETNDATTTNDAVTTEAAAQTTAAAQTDADVALRQEASLTPSRPGSVEVTHNYSLAPRIVGLETTVPERATVTRMDGFSATNGTVYEWDGDVETPTVTYSLPVNETGPGRHVAANGSLLSADVGEWALFSRPPTTTTWEARGSDPVTVDRRTVTDGPGAVGEWLVFLGPVEVYSRTTANQSFRLAVPAAANMTEPPRDVLAAMGRASADLAVGGRDDDVFAVAAPTEGVPWAVRGISVGDADFWVGADEELATTENLWIHEYVHTRQGYRTTSSTEWTDEAFATYYAALQALRYEPVTFDAFVDELALPANESTNATLTEPDTWGNRTAYRRGALVAGQIDRRIRLASDGDRTLADVFAAMNRGIERVNGSDLLLAVETAGNASVRETAETAVATDRPVSMWNRSQHVAAFGGLPARFRYGLASPNGTGEYRVTGPYRNATLSGDGGFTLVPNETLAVPARVTNVRDVGGYYDAALQVDGHVVASAIGRLSGEDTRTVPVNHTFTEPGTYTVGVGNDTVPVFVTPPRMGSIVGVSVSSGTVPQYSIATVNVSVNNDAAIPAERRVEITPGNDTTITRTVAVGPDTTKTVPIPVRFPTAGTTDLVVDGVGTLEIDVTPRPRPTPTPNPTRSPTPTGTTSGGIDPGFAGLLALLAFVAVLAVASYRY